GNSWDRSRPISAITCTATGLIWSAGSEPADRTSTFPLLSAVVSAAAIWERPALCTQTNNTHGRFFTSFLLRPALRALQPGWHLPGHVGSQASLVEQASQRAADQRPDDVGPESRLGARNGDAAVASQERRDSWPKVPGGVPARLGDRRKHGDEH